jgi:hypothetical protein
MLMNEIHAKIIDRFCERLYCPISLWWSSSNSFWGRKSIQ